MLLRLVSVLSLALALVWYRSGRVLRANILSVPALPAGYFQGGDWRTHCALVTDEAHDELRFCEDITFWDHFDAQGAQTDRLVLLGCDPNRKAWNTVMGPLRDPRPRGHLFLYRDPARRRARSTNATDAAGAPPQPEQEPALQKLELVGYPAEHDFHPLGLEVSPSRGDGRPSNLFVINHARGASTIEQFALDPAAPRAARYVRTLRSRWLVAPNALALTGDAAFFVSNDHLLTRRLPGVLGRVLPVLETFLGLPLGWVAHVSLEADGEGEGEGTEVALTHTFSALGVPFANGISLSPDGRTLAVASTSTGQILMYARDPHTNALAYDTAVPVPFLPDNVAHDDTGALLATGHPHFPSLAAVAAANVSSSATAPSWAVALARLPAMNLASPAAFARRAYDARAPLSASALAPASLTHDVETVFQSDGTAMMSSSATTLRDPATHGVYVAGLYGEGLLVCH